MSRLTTFACLSLSQCCSNEIIRMSTPVYIQLEPFLFHPRASTIQMKQQISDDNVTRLLLKVDYRSMSRSCKTLTSPAVDTQHTEQRIYFCFNSSPILSTRSWLNNPVRITYAVSCVGASCTLLYVFSVVMTESRTPKTKPVSGLGTARNKNGGQSTSISATRYQLDKTIHQAFPSLSLLPRPDGLESTTTTKKKGEKHVAMTTE